MRLAIVAACLLAAVPAIAQETEDHTASWFAQHPAQMKAQMRACQEDPGHGKNVANCANATQGYFDRTAVDYERRYNAMVTQGKADQIQQWRANPQTLAFRLQACNAAKPEVRSVLDCPLAYDTAKQMVAAAKH